MIFRRKKKKFEKEAIKIPTIEEVDAVVKKNQELEKLEHDTLVKKTVELSKYLQKRYSPYLEKFEIEDIYVKLKDENEWYCIYKDKVCVKTHNIMIVYDCHQLDFINRIDKIIESADKKIIELFNEKENSNKCKQQKIQYMDSIKKSEENDYGED